MPFANYSSANTARAELDAGAGASATVILLKSGQGDLFPSTFPFFAVLEWYFGTQVVRREIVLVTGKTGDALDVTRSAGYCPASATATTQTNTAFAFESGDSFTHILTAEQQKDVQDEVERLETDKLDKTEYNLEKQVFASSSTGVDDYAITSSDVVAYNNGQTLKVQADVANVGSATLKLNDLPVKNLLKLSEGAFVHLSTGDIIANQIFYATFNEAIDAFQFSVDPATAVVPVISSIQKEFTVGENVTVGDALQPYVTTDFAGANGVAYSFTQTSSNWRGFRILANKSGEIVTVTKHASTSHTQCRILTDANVLIQQVAFSGNVATFTNVPVVSGTHYKVECGSNGSSANHAYDSNNTYPIATTPVNYVSGTENGGTFAGRHGITTMTLREPTTDGKLYKTDASNKYKVGFIWFADDTVSANSLVKVNVDGIDPNKSGLTVGSDYYLTNTAGAVGTTPGTEVVKIGTAISATDLKIGAYKPGYVSSVAVSASVSVPVNAMFAIVSATATDAGARTQAGDMFLCRYGKTSATVQAGETNSASNTPTVSASWSGNTITFSGATTIGGTVFFYSSL